MLHFSVIIPVFNRPDELDELLESLTNQTCKDFEVVVVDDGSERRCDFVVEKYKKALSVTYFYKENSGPGQTRNYAAERSKGEYLLILDSDCIAPAEYIASIEKELKNFPCDAFGGPDRAHPSFSDLQKAINYAMTSFFTTGGIRGGAQKLDKFYPRSFNMGIRASVFEQLKGFSSMRFGEDIDLSIRIFENGFTCRLFPESWVYHKRRTDLKKFFKQVHNSGIARINLYKRHPKSLKIVHLLPACFTIGLLFLCFLGCCWLYAWGVVVVYVLMLFVDATIKERSVKIGALAIMTSFTQLIGYGTGFLRAFWQRIILKKGEFGAFEKNFYN